ncbi:long-chain acyl-CoA synthetase [Williamwhitmania taraxaci]|uniref:Long-chain acyl-CoA synthetase n=1 Tax=Williamwhitmania taraxaci TaxID=1640674 RepID=A0A1G6KZT7_9BACT|nr:AMP-binding protein [Williamwhitmania taraxaci]SDC36341.1 long-chain acyl-CoA synthetase [Williamwhitmania taraxaci]
MIAQNFIKEYIEKSLQENWNSPAFSDYQGKTIPFSTVAKDVVRIHQMLEMWGIKPGDKVALVGRNSSSWATSYLAIISYGAVVVPVLADFAVADIHHIINHSDSKILFTSDQIWENIDESSMPHLTAIFSLTQFNLLVSRNDDATNQLKSEVDNLTKKLEELTPNDINFREISNDKLGVISYTSGTTGFSKGVMLPLNSLAANVLFGHNNIPLQAGDKIVSFLPLAHAYGCAFEFLWPFSVGCHITFLTKTPAPKTIIQAFEQVRPKLILTVPLIMEKIYKKQILPTLNKQPMKLLLNVPLLDKKIYQQINKKLSEVFGGNFMQVIIGGAPLNSEVEDFLKKIKFPFTVGFGMTECGPLISYAAWADNPQGACGKILPTLSVKIDSADPFVEVGEIMVKGENVMMGYYKNPEATNSAITSDGWLRTGDLGLIDSENYIYIKGRSKSMILGPSGQNIYPEEIEAKLNNMPYIQESLVVEKNNRLVALIYPDYETADEAGLNAEDLALIMEENKKILNSVLPAFMQIQKTKLYPEEFEKTPKKSIKRFLYLSVEI